MAVKMTGRFPALPLVGAVVLAAVCLRCDFAALDCDNAGVVAGIVADLPMGPGGVADTHPPDRAEAGNAIGDIGAIGTEIGDSDLSGDRRAAWMTSFALRHIRS